jgi:hypothetical protein
VTIAAALATRAPSGPSALVRAGFADDPAATAAPVAAEGAAPGSPQVVTPTGVLRRAEAGALRVRRTLRRDHGRVRVTNRVTGRVTGSVGQVERSSGTSAPRRPVE